MEALLGTKFYRQVGMLSAWPTTEIDQVTAAAADAGLPVTLLDTAAFPHVRFPADSVGVLEHQGGVLLADHALAAVVRWLAEQPNVTLRPWQEVKAVDPETGEVHLPDAETLESDLTLIATGPWSKNLVDLPMLLHRQTLVYLKPPEDLAAVWDRTPGIGRIGSKVPPGCCRRARAPCSRRARPPSAGRPTWPPTAARPKNSAGPSRCWPNRS